MALAFRFYFARGIKKGMPQSFAALAEEARRIQAEGRIEDTAC
jgi:hypothetical protein